MFIDWPHHGIRHLTLWRGSGKYRLNLDDMEQSQNPSNHQGTKDTKQTTKPY
jgi:hypothetical protein